MRPRHSCRGRSDAPESRGHRAPVKTRRERHKASDDRNALPGGRQQMVVEVPRDEAPGGALGIGSTVELHGYGATREAAMTAFAKSWRRG